MKYYTEWSVHTPIAVRNKANGDRWWFSDLDDEHKNEALDLPAFDINRKVMVDPASRKHAFIMHRKQLRV